MMKWDYSSRNIFMWWWGAITLPSRNARVRICVHLDFIMAMVKWCHFPTSRAISQGTDWVYTLPDLIERLYPSFVLTQLWHYYYYYITKLLCNWCRRMKAGLSLHGVTLCSMRTKLIEYKSGIVSADSKWSNTPLPPPPSLPLALSQLVLPRDPIQTIIYFFVFISISVFTQCLWSWPTVRRGLSPIIASCQVCGVLCGWVWRVGQHRAALHGQADTEGYDTKHRCVMFEMSVAAKIRTKYSNEINLRNTCIHTNTHTHKHTHT